ncbi:MAG: proton-conducting transporter membrane subunit [Ornithinimicrobium sp.]|uniref:NADH-quinone oxidoreductase subunit 5 family protein n=1 Tax=Ornithinimicrobium sp. TaxID=1977084 RepID=UPI0026DF6284|nr:proton-conducting transporter membrane subunit [Ornithinimicrobium sp.]MDO5741151.1 proton-conducting transporter membrane subunit [Ornithinimicrobium sp.]
MNPGTAAIPDLPDLSWSDFQLPSITLPHLPVPDLWGTPAQWAILLPALAALAGITLSGRSNRLAAWIAVGGGFGAFFATLWQLYALNQTASGQRVSGTTGALPFGGLDVPFELTVTWPLALIAVTVATVALIVQVYSRWYLWYDPHYRAFAATVSIFTAAMLLTVLADDILLLLVGWEVMGWCSYLLIGHHSTKAAARRAAGKAMLVTRTADIGFVLGLVGLAAGAGTTKISAIVDHWSTQGPSRALALVLLLVVIGVAGKSALFPFQDWLPDAMEGPTPASALIHAATMVAAGTVVLTHLFPLLAMTDSVRLVLAVLACFTMLGAALLAFAQGDLKRLLAWSTISQVALMLGALAAATPGTGPDAAAQHLIAHAWYKALLFLAVGWLAVLVGGTAMAVVASGARRYRVLRRRFAWGLLALAGVPPFVGFFSKEQILGTAEMGALTDGGLAAVIVLSSVGAAAPLTAAYCMRAWLVLNRPTDLEQHVATYAQGPVERIDDFFEEPAVLREAEGVERAESAISSSARLGTTVLVLMCLAGGVVASMPVWRSDVHLNLELLVATLLLMVVAAAAVSLAARGVRTRDAAARIPATLSIAAEKGLGADYAYRLLVAQPVLAAARAVTWFDREVLDAWVRGVGAGSRLAGLAADLLSPRRATPAIGLVLVGVLVLAGIGVVTR